MSKLSRRSLVASAAALPALAVPAVAVASAEPSDDTELLRLGALFEPIEREYYGRIAAEPDDDEEDP
jgi:hypothetical protein